jgi:geranylgeranyl diphosphate synthase type I
VLARYQAALEVELRDALGDAWAQTGNVPIVAEPLAEFAGQIEYHLGWRHADFSPAKSHPGKLLRPTLLLLASELAGGRVGMSDAERADTVERALPAAACIELVHNFSLIHDDIEDGDEERRHRPTMWKLWGIPHAINSGDGLFSLARMRLWKLVDHGVDPVVVVRLAALLDRTCLELCEGQYLDMRNEGQHDVTIALYLEMIRRKTAALIACATEMGARIAAPDLNAVADELARFGAALGMAFQLRDDLLGIWSAEQLGKTPMGDLRRRKMTLPVIHALETANAADRDLLLAFYSASEVATDADVANVLAVLERTGARNRVRKALQREGDAALAALDAAAGTADEAHEARDLLASLVAFVTRAAQQ